MVRTAAFRALVATLVVFGSNIGVNYLIRDYHVSVLGSAVLPAHELLVTEIIVVIIGAFVGVAGSSVAVRRFLDV